MLKKFGKKLTNKVKTHITKPSNVSPVSKFVRSANKRNKLLEKTFNENFQEKNMSPMGPGTYGSKKGRPPKKKKVKKK